VPKQIIASRAAPTTKFPDPDMPEVVDGGIDGIAMFDA